MKSPLALRICALLLLGCVTAMPAGAQPAKKSPDPGAVLLPTLAKIRESGVIVVAHREASLPFSYLDQNRRPIGYAIDLCMKVVDALRRDMKLPNLRVEYLAVTPADRIQAIAEGKADLECGSTTNNAARRKQVAFTVTHYFAGAKLLTRTDSRIERLSDASGRTIVSTRGTSPLAALRSAVDKGMIASRIVEGRDHDESFAILERGEADAFAMDDILLYGLRANSKDPARWAIVGELITVEPLAIMLRRNDPEFKKYVDIVLSRAMIDGEAKVLYTKWFLSPIPPRGVNLNIPLSPLMRDQLAFPTDKVGDELGG